MVFTNIIIGYRSKRQKKIWEARGQYNALYTTWASERNINSYQLFVLYAIDGYDVITQKMIAAYTGLSKQTVNTVIRALKESGYTAAKQTSSFPHKKEIRQFGAQTRDLAKRSRV